MIIADLSDECSGSGISVSVAASFKDRIELMYRELLAKEVMDGVLSDPEANTMNCLERASI